MKRHLLYLSVFLCAASLNAQQFTDPGFENWSSQGGFPFPTYDDTDDWSTLNSATSLTSTFTATKATGGDVHSGSSAIRLETKSILGNDANGIVTNGTINTTTYAIEGGVPFTARPDSLTGWYKSTPSGGDLPTMEVVLKDAADDTIGHAKFMGPTTAVGSYTRFSAPVVYQSTATPTTAIALFSSSNGFNAVEGSVLFIDDIELIYNPPGAGIQEEEKIHLSVYPNPTSEKITLIGYDTKELNMMLSDLTGRMILSVSGLLQGNSVDLSLLESGIYIYCLVEEDGTVIKSDKLVISR